VANAILAGTVNAHFNENIFGASNQNIQDAVAFLQQGFTRLVAPQKTLTWATAREEFVDNFSRLVLRSSTQVGTNTRKSFGDIEAFINYFVRNDTEIQNKLLTRSV
jgi:hypothetical protein